MVNNKEPENYEEMREALNAPVQQWEVIEKLRQAMVVTKRRKPHTRALDDWEIINGAWELFTRWGLLETTPRKYLYTACYRSIVGYLIHRYRYKSPTLNKSLIYLRDSIHDSKGAKEKIYGATDNRWRPYEVTNYERVLTILEKAHLREGYRTIIKLYYFDGLTQEQVAKEIGVTRQAVCTAKAKALKILRHYAETNNI